MLFQTLTNNLRYTLVHHLGPQLNPPNTIGYSNRNIRDKLGSAQCITSIYIQVFTSDFIKIFHTPLCEIAISFLISHGVSED